MPASTILVLEAVRDRRASLAPILTSAGYTVTRTADPTRRSRRSSSTSWSSSTSAAAAPGQDRRRDLPRDPRDAVDGGRADPVRRPRPMTSRSASASSRPVRTTSSPGRSMPARSRPGSRRCCCASSARRTSPPVVSSDGLTLARARRIVAVYSPKGGVGTTTIATNIAIAAAQRRPDRVVLVDLDLQFGGVATHLNLDPKQTLADVVRDEAALREPELLRTYAMRHDSGLHVLAAADHAGRGGAHHARPHRRSSRPSSRATSPS